MDYYDVYESDLNDQHDYNVCMAKCPDYKTAKECGCSGSGDLPFTTVLAIFSPFIILAIVLIVAQVYDAIREHKQKKEYEEYQRRQKMGDTKWVKEYEARREKAYNDYRKSTIRKENRK